MDISELREQLEREEREYNKWNDWSVVERLIDAAIAQVVAHDFELLEDGAGERSVAHRLAAYLEQEFPGWHIDCEFNRQGDTEYRVTKRVNPNPPLLPESRRGQGTADVTPDIIIHRRRTSRNLVAIEVKPSDSADLARDREKLRRYLNAPHLNYAFAVLIKYHNGASAFDPMERVTVG
jgi:hypothetical protein